MYRKGDWGLLHPDIGVHAPGPRPVWPLNHSETDKISKHPTSLARLLKQQQQLNQISKGLPPLVLKPLFVTQQSTGSLDLHVSVTVISLNHLHIERLWCEQGSLILYRAV